MLKLMFALQQNKGVHWQPTALQSGVPSPRGGSNQTGEHLWWAKGWDRALVMWSSAALYSYWVTDFAAGTVPTLMFPCTGYPVLCSRLWDLGFQIILVNLVIPVLCSYCISIGKQVGAEYVEMKCKAIWSTYHVQELKNVTIFFWSTL